MDNTVDLLTDINNEYHLLDTKRKAVFDCLLDRWPYLFQDRILGFYPNNMVESAMLNKERYLIKYRE